jgi:predicted acylesterase/phospholipase RssA
MKRILLFLLAVGTLSWTVSGCSIFGDEYLIYSQPCPTKRTYESPDDGDFFLAVAVSGGGSRSAVWSAAVLKELHTQVKLPDGRSIIDEIDYMSSISGGSLSMAYYCLKKPSVDTTHTDAYDAFFDEYLTDMRRNIEKDLFLRPWLWYRLLLPPEELAILLSWDFDRNYFHGVNFDDLAKRQRLGWCPTLIINGTVMDTGAKFLFTTLSRKDFDYGTAISSGLYDDTGLARSNVIFTGDILGVNFCEDIGLSIGDMDISRAVVASAAVPLIFGPVILGNQCPLVSDDASYIHINDGGIGDTLGLETIMQLAIDRFNDPERSYRGGMVIIIDANHLIDPTDSLSTIEGFTSVDLVRRSREIYAYRGKNLAYLSIMFMQKDDPAIQYIRFVYISPYMVDDPDMIEKVKATPTRFKIKPELADNLEAAAEIVVHDVTERILKNFEGEDPQDLAPLFYAPPK